MTVDNLRILTTNFAPMFNFYSKNLGLKPTWGDENSTYSSFADESGVTRIALFSRDEMCQALGIPSSEAPAQPANVLILSVPDLYSFYQEAIGRGTKFLREPKAMPDWGIHVAHLQDPDGNWIEVISEMAKTDWSDKLLAEAAC